MGSVLLNATKQQCGGMHYEKRIYLIMSSDEFSSFPDVRDGLTRKERIVLACIDQLQKERDGRNLPTETLYGRVVEYVDTSEEEFQNILQRISNMDHRR